MQRARGSVEWPTWLRCSVSCSPAVNALSHVSRCSGDHRTQAVVTRTATTSEDNGGRWDTTGSIVAKQQHLHHYCQQQQQLTGTYDSSQLTGLPQPVNDKRPTCRELASRVQRFASSRACMWRMFNNNAGTKRSDVGGTDTANGRVSDVLPLAN